MRTSRPETLRDVGQVRPWAPMSGNVVGSRAELPMAGTVDRIRVSCPDGTVEGELHSFTVTGEGRIAFGKPFTIRTDAGERWVVTPGTWAAP